MRFTRTLIVLTVVVGAILALAGNALAQNTSGPHEGAGGNSVVCNGVPTHAILMYYANGGIDSCGHRDIKAIWGAMGITPQVAKMMHSGRICSSGGFTSSGRQHSPNVALDRLVSAGGSQVFFRPLSVWGSTCYSAWVGKTEDGRTVAVLKGCGNSETTRVPPKAPKPKAKKPAKPKPTVVQQAPVCITAAGVPLYAVPPGLVVQNGVCVTTVVTTTQTCGPNQHVENNVCVNNTNVNTNTNTQTQTNTQTTTVLVNNNTPPPPPAPTCQTSGATNIGGPLPCQFPPPPTPTVSVSFNNVQEVYTNESRANTCATVTTNLPMTIQVTADYGSWSGVSPASANGSQLVCGTYTGPSEPLTDTWHVKVFYNGVLVTDATHTISIVQTASNP